MLKDVLGEWFKIIYFGLYAHKRFYRYACCEQMKELIICSLSLRHYEVFVMYVHSRFVSLCGEQLFCKS
jgi:hypothetical protein